MVKLLPSETKVGLKLITKVDQQELITKPLKTVASFLLSFQECQRHSHFSYFYVSLAAGLHDKMYMYLFFLRKHAKDLEHG